jgi:hypothetical protein
MKEAVRRGMKEAVRRGMKEAGRRRDEEGRQEGEMKKADRRVAEGCGEEGVKRRRAGREGDEGATNRDMKEAGGADERGGKERDKGSGNRWVERS